MASFSDALENKLLDHTFGATAFTKPTSRTVALYTVAPSDTGGGTEVPTSGTAYARKAVTFGAASGGVVTNSADVTFTAATASWGTVTHIGIFDNNGVFLAWSPLGTSKTVASGDIFKIPETDLSITLT